MDPALLATLRVHNPWLDRPGDQQTLLAASVPEPFIARHRRLELRPGRAELVVGPRQAGKSTWIRQVLAQFEAPVLVLHAEEPRIRELAHSPALALAALTEVLSPETLLLFEEVQHLGEAPLFIKGLVDLDKKRRIIATGNSSFELGARTRESLAGRARRIQLLPFSLQEVGSVVPAGLAPAIRDLRLRDLWEKLVVTGGYPEPWFDPAPAAALRYLVEAFVLKDTSDLHKIERPSVFRKLLELAAADIGNLVNLTDWAALAQASRNTVGRYLEIAEEAHVLRLVPPFAGGKRSEVTGTPKVFFLDNGLRNAVFGGFKASLERSDRGALWENAVFNELAKRLELLDEIRFWRSKSGAEVDFVIQRGERMVAIEVKAAELARPLVSRGTHSFLEAYRPACLGVVNASLRLDTVEEGVPVRFVRPWEIDLVLGELQS
jgi:predicted AAA+ superfamily ATPase